MLTRIAASIKLKPGMAFALMVVLLILLPAGSAWADTYLVDRTDDNAGATDCTAAINDCSLRGAITKANSHAGADRIVLPDRTFNLTLPGVEDDNKSGDLDIKASGGNLRIEGEGAGVTIINGRASQPPLVPGVDRVFHINPEGTESIRVEIIGVSIQYGYAETYGGGIYIEGNGTVDLTSSAIMSNTVTIASPVVPGGGGGIFNDQATLSLRNTDVMNNAARGVVVGSQVAGGGILLESTAVMTLTNGTVAWNEVSSIPGGGSSARGGGLANLHGKATIHAGTFQGNQASGGSSGSIGTGGGIANESMGRLTLDQESVLLDNWADQYGGGIANTDSILVIENSSLSLNASGHTGGGIYNYLSTATLTDTTVTLNTADAIGGGLSGMEDEMSLTRCMVSGNKAFGGDGGGIYDALGTVTVVDSTLYANRTAESGGGLHAHGSTVYVTGSTFSDNIAQEPTGGPVSNHGGGMYLWIATAHVVNSTLSGNRAEESGGGVYSLESVLSLSHTTIAENVADADGDGHGDGGGIFGADAEKPAIVNTIVAGNFDRGGQAPECGGVGLSGHGDNIIQDRTGCSISTGSGTNWALDPRLEALGNNGGPTETHALLPGSPAVDRVSNGCRTFLNETLTSDQRGMARPQGQACDIGSYEAPYRVYLPLVVRNVQP